MSRVEINEAALQRVMQDAVKTAVAKIDHDMAELRGKPIEEVKPALERSMRGHGITPNTRGQDFKRMA